MRLIHPFRAMRGCAESCVGLAARRGSCAPAAPAEAKLDRDGRGAGASSLVTDSLLVLPVSLLMMCAVASAESPDLIFRDGFEPCAGSTPSVTVGSGSAIILHGMVITPTLAFVGEVLVQGDTITCAAASCAGQPGADNATIVETAGLIFPGLIDTRNTILFDIFDANDWTPSQLYTNHSQWPNEARFGALVDAKQYLNGEASSPVDYGCEMDKYGELKALVAGTTAVVGAAIPANRPCYGSLARTIDQSSNDLGADYMQVNTLIPTTGAADQVCSNFASGSTHAYLVNVAEGVDTAARNEFATLGTVTTTDLCLYAPQTTIVHGTALGDAEFTRMASAGMSLAWLPRSNVNLYGATANVPLAIAKGVNVALGTDWSISGSHDLLDALRFADQVDNTTWDNVLSAFDLVQMVTTRAARALALDAVLGSIEPGKKADLTVITGGCAAPWSALVGARPSTVRLVLVGGVPLYGDVALQAIAPALPGCEALDVCGVPKFVCVAETGGTPTNKFGQTLADIVGTLTTGLSVYDALDLTPWDFSPITPLVDCP
jgi:hypothetical protein